MKRFSDEELFDLRNNVPMNGLIKQLRIPSKFSEGYDRFLCPDCNEFQTSISRTTNLARCFLCKKSNNTIEMVMKCHNTGFVESVQYLQAHRKTIENLSCDKSDKSNIRTGEPLSLGTILRDLKMET